MKQFLFFLTLSLLFFSSCTKTINQVDCDSELIEGLQQFNYELQMENAVTKSELDLNLDSLGISFADFLEIILADIGGAFTGAEIGAGLGLEIGSVVGLPVYGGLTFAFCAAVGVGAFESYYAFPDSSVVIPADTSDYVIDSSLVALALRPNQTVESDYEYMIQSITTALMLEQKDDASISDLNIAMIEPDMFSFPLLNTHNIHKFAGYLHNVVLADLMKRNQLDVVSDSINGRGQKIQSTIRGIFDDPRIKMVIHNRDSYIGSVVAGNGISNKVLACFEDVFRTSVYCVDDLCNIVNEYVNRIEQSGEVDEKGKDSLMYAFSVACYSYCYWLNHFSR